MEIYSSMSNTQIQNVFTPVVY